MPGDAALGQVLRRTDRGAKLAHQAAVRHDERLGINIQPFQQRWGASFDVAALVLADYPASLVGGEGATKWGSCSFSRPAFRWSR